MSELPDYNEDGSANPKGDAVYWRARAERAEAELQAYRDDRAAVMAERCGDERHCTCVPALRAELERVRERERWIPVGERLPKPGEMVLVFGHRNHKIAPVVWTAEYRSPNCDHIWCDDMTFEYLNVTHWKLSDPPTQEAND